jgi:hypothetical protein
MTVSLVEMLGLDLLSKVGSKIAELETENVELRDQLRWRKWPEEKPRRNGKYLTRWSNDEDDDVHVNEYRDSDWVFGARPTHWRPIGPLPKEGE